MNCDCYVTIATFVTIVTQILRVYNWYSFRWKRRFYIHYNYWQVKSVSLFISSTWQPVSWETFFVWNAGDNNTAFTWQDARSDLLENDASGTSPSWDVPSTFYCEGAQRKTQDSWRDHVSWLAWEHLGIPLEDLGQVVEEREFWVSLLKMLPLRPNTG